VTTDSVVDDRTDVDSDADVIDDGTSVFVLLVFAIAIAVVGALSLLSGHVSSCSVAKKNGAGKANSTAKPTTTADARLAPFTVLVAHRARISTLLPRLRNELKKKKKIILDH
jgi:hypothetical protein